MQLGVFVEEINIKIPKIIVKYQITIMIAYLFFMEDYILFTYF